MNVYDENLLCYLSLFISFTSQIFFHSKQSHVLVRDSQGKHSKPTDLFKFNLGNTQVILFLKKYQIALYLFPKCIFYISLIIKEASHVFQIFQNASIRKKYSNQLIEPSYLRDEEAKVQRGQPNPPGTQISFLPLCNLPVASLTYGNSRTEESIA